MTFHLSFESALRLYKLNLQIAVFVAYEYINTYHDVISTVYLDDSKNFQCYGQLN